MNVFKYLLAKSVPQQSTVLPKACLLGNHLADVHSVAQAIIDEVGDLALESVGLQNDVWKTRLRKSLTLAAGAHDLGKANDRFQAMLRGDKILGKQPVRHEAISIYLMLCVAEVHDVLFPSDGPTIEDTCSLLAILGHHVKYYDRGSLVAGRSSLDTSENVKLLVDHVDFNNCLSLINIKIGNFYLPKIPANQILYEVDNEITNIFDKFIDQFGRKPIERLESEWGRFLTLIKVLLMTCDGAGSAIPRHPGVSPAQWIKSCLEKRLREGSLTSVIQKRLNGRPLRNFQRDIASSATRITVAIAGCGTGKTLGAYGWANIRAINRKLCVCYPTTGTATEGFGDYVMESDVPSDLVHSRASVDLSLLSNKPTTNSSLKPNNNFSQFLKIKGLEHISCTVAVSTVDAVLGMLQNHKRGLYSSAAIVSSAFIFDEIHSYDESLWRTLLYALRLMRGAPILLMTATLQEHRRAELATLFSNEISFVEGPADLELMPRYIIQDISQNDAMTLAAESVKVGKRVLFVSNTVDRTMKRADKVAKLLNCVQGESPVLIYHSRFKYEDRVCRHRELIDYFQINPGQSGVAGFTTQVAEMSLDIDADILITDLAPMSAIIQRLGRLNRNVDPTSCSPRCCYVVDVEDKKSMPYEVNDLQLARQWLDSLRGSPKSQRDLAQAFNALSPNICDTNVDDVVPSLIGSPIRAYPGNLRDQGVTGLVHSGR